MVARSKEGRRILDWVIEGMTGVEWKISLRSKSLSSWNDLAISSIREEFSMSNLSIALIVFSWLTRRSSVHEQFLHFRLHAFINLDERRPGAFETFAREFLRRVNAEFAADGDFAGRGVEHIGRFHFFTNGLPIFSCGNAEKSRSTDQRSLTPWCRHKAAMRAS